MEVNNVSITQLILGIISILITVLGAQLSSFMNIKINNVKDSVKNEKVNKYIDNALDIIRKVVISLNQTTVGKLKVAASDGKLTEEEINDITTGAIETVLNTLSENTKEQLSMIYGDVEDWIYINIQNFIVKEKFNNVLLEGVTILQTQTDETTSE